MISTAFQVLQNLVFKHNTVLKSPISLKESSIIRDEYVKVHLTQFFLYLERKDFCHSNNNLYKQIWFRLFKLHFEAKTTADKANFGIPVCLINVFVMT